MAFTYNLASSGNTLLVAKVRLELGDTTSGIGVRPDGSNLSDEEIQMWLTDESSHIMRTVARACYALSRMWSNVASTSSPSYSEQAGKISSEWAARGDGITKLYGGPSGLGGLQAAQMGRSDGYSQNNPQPTLTEHAGNGPIYILP